MKGYVNGSRLEEKLNEGVDIGATGFSNVVTAKVCEVQLLSQKVFVVCVCLLCFVFVCCFRFSFPCVVFGALCFCQLIVLCLCFFVVCLSVCSVLFLFVCLFVFLLCLCVFVLLFVCVFVFVYVSVCVCCC